MGTEENKSSFSYYINGHFNIQDISTFRRIPLEGDGINA